MTAKDVEPRAKPTDAPSSFTINPNQLLSTIFRIPNVFPTLAIAPDPITEIANIGTGPKVELLPASTESDEYFDDNETTWIRKNVASQKNVTQKQPTKVKAMESNQTKPKSSTTTTTTTTEKAISSTIAADKPLKGIKGSSEKVVELLGSFGKENFMQCTSGSDSGIHFIE